MPADADEVEGFPFVVFAKEDAGRGREQGHESRLVYAVCCSTSPRVSEYSSTQNLARPSQPSGVKQPRSGQGAGTSAADGVERHVDGVLDRLINQRQKWDHSEAHDARTPALKAPELCEAELGLVHDPVDAVHRNDERSQPLKDQLRRIDARRRGSESRSACVFAHIKQLQRFAHPMGQGQSGLLDVVVVLPFLVRQVEAVSQNVGPRNGVGGLHHGRAEHWPERLSNIRAIRHIALGFNDALHCAGIPSYIRQSCKGLAALVSPKRAFNRATYAVYRAGDSRKGLTSSSSSLEASTRSQIRHSPQNPAFEKPGAPRRTNGRRRAEQLLMRFEAQVVDTGDSRCFGGEPRAQHQAEGQRQKG
eukprot:scaffold391_cov223-Pinguiococcus_pyrenoidosus.AAC.1